MNLDRYYLSIAQELEALKDRVRNLIADGHWLTDGEWKESVLRSIIGQRLPESIKIGRGFVLFENAGGNQNQRNATTQCDILIYRSDVPVLFRDGGLVFITPDAALAVIEVKTKLSKKNFKKAVGKLNKISMQLRPTNPNIHFGLFSFDSDEVMGNWVEAGLQSGSISDSLPIEFLTLGPNYFVRWWQQNPSGENADYKKWHLYGLTQKAAGYFIANVIDCVCGGKLSKVSPFWYPQSGKEGDKLAEILPN
jgi:hypothetical protein